jgi:acetyl/propionyl-CoA carboxylase alpha subunit/acetyl-CoA carboxylase carboxyltransferase component
MQRLLIANRGEIALRIAQTARELGLSTVAIFSPEDAALATGYGTDESVALDGRGAAAYLDVGQIIEIAKTQNCDALHPGYGFLSESAALAAACAKADILFVGPAADTLKLFGDKAAARALAEGLNVPIVPGIAAPASIDDATAFLEDPSNDGAIMLKAIAGGGGRGMRAVRDASDLSDAFTRCQSEALRSFGSDVLFAEKLVENARHIEIQIVADRTGETGHLWERECTLQRRNQKLIEIAPAPGLDPVLRSKLIDAARSLAKASGYHGIGTFEFLVDAADSAYFIECNPRLQVEHTVTEEITGVDLVEVQLRIAEGKTLKDLGLDEPTAARGHAIQLRVLAESLDESGTVKPDGTRIDVLTLPAGPGVRVDTAMRAGLGAHPSFDSLLAKLIVSSPDADYARAVRRARRAVSSFRIEGPRTNLDLLAALIDREEFLENDLSTSFIADQTHALVVDAEARRNARLERTDYAGNDSSTVGAAASPTLAAGTLAVRAPLIGTVIEVCTDENESVTIGQPIFVLESMKMEHVILAEAAGVIGPLFVSAGDVVAETEILAGIARSGATEEHAAETEERDIESIRPDLAESNARHALLFDESRPEAVARRRSRGQRTARENLHALCDEDSFIEYGALAVAAMRKTRSLEELHRKTPADAIITGFGTVNADLFDAETARCAVLVVDATVLAGTQGYFHHRKIDRLLELAERHETPVVFFPEGGGGRPNDTDSGSVVAAGLNVTSFHAFARLSGKVPRVSIVSGFCFAGSAAFAGCSDVIIATRNSSLGMGGPAMIEGGGLGVFEPNEIGPAELLEPVGVVDLLVEDETEAVAVAKRYLSYFQGPKSDWACDDQRKLRHLIPENRRRVYDVRAVIDTLCDEDSVLELRRGFGVGMITAFVRIEGHAMGLIANDPMHLGGAIDDTGAEKAARFLQLCDSFGIPVLSLCDTPGFMVGPEIEMRGQVRKVSRLFVAGARMTVPLFTVILRKGYGLGAQAMAGGSFVAPFFTVAWPTGEIGGMGLEGAVRLGFKKQLEAISDEAERQQFFEDAVARMYDRGKALNAASLLEFDAVIDPTETRSHIVRGLNTAGSSPSGSGRFVDTW